jgi:hypothetical protein
MCGPCQTKNTASWSRSTAPSATNRAALQDHAAPLFNSRLLAAQETPWDEAAIDARGDRLIDVLLTTRPVPHGHDGVVVDTYEKSATWIQVKHFVEAGLIQFAATLTPHWEPGDHAWRACTARLDRAVDAWRELRRGYTAAVAVRP